jgi:AcrR family transcriptional regulator
MSQDSVLWAAETGAGTPGTTLGPTAQKLVLAAVQSFAARGYEGTSVRDIERRIGLKRGLASYHFGTKEELWKACVDWLMGRFHNEMTVYRDVLRMVSEIERERLLLKIYTRFVAKNPEFVRILVTEGMSFSKRAEWMATRLRESLDFFDEVTGRKDDFDSPEDAAMSYYLFVGAASLLFAVPAQCKYLFGVVPGPEMLDQFADLAADIGYDIRRHRLFGKTNRGDGADLAESRRR